MYVVCTCMLAADNILFCGTRDKIHEYNLLMMGNKLETMHKVPSSILPYLRSNTKHELITTTQTYS